eukprot:6095436-Prymnesium_polylepis.1
MLAARARSAVNPYVKGKLVKAVSPRAQATFEARQKDRLSEKFTGLEQFVGETKLCKGRASGNNNNCLLSSLAQATGLLHPQQVEQPGVYLMVDDLRVQLHTQLDQVLQDEAPAAGAEQWDVGWDRARARDNLKLRLMMGQAHISVAAHMLRRIIIVLQFADDGKPGLMSCGGHHLAAVVYEPGYAMPREDAKKVEVLQLLGGDNSALALYLAGGHFEPLVRVEQCNARAFPPRTLKQMLMK